MAHQHGLDLCGSQSLARHLDRVVRSAEDVPQRILRVDISPVAVHPDAVEAAPVRVEVALLVAPETARHTWPRIADHELADLSANRMPLGIDHVRGDSRYGTGKGARPQVRDHVAAQDAA